MMINNPATFNDVPSGYQSRKHHQRYMPLMTVILVCAFLAQALMPVIVYVGGRRSLGMYYSHRFRPFYFDMFVWQDALWYPLGNNRGEWKIKSFDFHGKPLNRPEISTPYSFHNYVVDGDRLWAVSNRGVAEIQADGSPPLEIDSQRFLHHPAAFLYDGKLAVADWGYDDSPLIMYVFENGEWQVKEELVVCINAPADALNPTDGSRQRVAANRRAERIPFVDHFDHFQVAKSGKTCFAVCSFPGKVFHRTNLPFISLDAAETGPETWIEMIPYRLPCSNSELTTVAGDLAVLRSSVDNSEIELWRHTAGNWVKATRMPLRKSGSLTRLWAFTTPDGSRSFAVFEYDKGRSNDLMELFPDRIERVTALGNSEEHLFVPKTSIFGVTALSLISPIVSMSLFVLIASWLIQTHREPCYVKGPIAVRFATLLRRYLASLLDLGLCIGPIALGWLMGLFSNLLPGLLATAVWSGVFFIANWLMLARGGFTFGKWLCGVRVVRTSLEPPGLSRSLIRLFIWPAETGMFSGVVAFSLIAFTFNRQRLADLMAGCVVLQADSLRLALAEHTDSIPQ